MSLFSTSDDDSATTNTAIAAATKLTQLLILSLRDPEALRHRTSIAAAQTARVRRESLVPS